MSGFDYKKMGKNKIAMAYTAKEKKVKTFFDVR
jgi:hypothetical protein